MKRTLGLFVAAALGCLALWLVSSSLAATPHSRADGAAPLVLLATIDVGGSPDAIEVDCCDERNDVAFLDLSAQELRFLDGNTFQLAPEEISLPSWGFDGWMAYDRSHHLIYALQVRSRDTISPWQEVMVHVVHSRTVTNTFSVNGSYNSLTPTDSSYMIEGLAFQQPLSEGDNPGRLIVDNKVRGNVDVVDFNAAGTAAAQLHRASYRDPAPGPSYWDNGGNSLALETQHETLAVDDLADFDVLYIADLNDPDLGPPDGYGFIQVLTLTQPLTDLVTGRLPDVDLNDIWPFWNGVQGLAVAGPRDTLYVASAIQSFDNGYVGRVDMTDHQSAQVTTLTYADPGFVLVDWYDPKRVFVTTFDGWYNDPHQGLYLHLMYDGAVVDTLRLLDDFDEYSGPHGMAFDPYHRLLYLTVGSTIMVVQVNHGLNPPPLAGSALVEPGGGQVVLPDGGVWVHCPAGALNQDTVVTLTESSPSPAGELAGVRFFQLTAVVSGTATPVTQTNAPCTIAVDYTEAQRRAAIESTLQVYQQDGGTGQWSSEGITSTVDGAANVVTAQLSHFGPSAVLGETRRVYLPLVLRNH